MLGAGLPQPPCILLPTVAVDDSWAKTWQSLPTTLHLSVSDRGQSQDGGRIPPCIPDCQPIPSPGGRATKALQLGLTPPSSADPASLEEFKRRIRIPSGPRPATSWSQPGEALRCLRLMGQSQGVSKAGYRTGVRWGLISHFCFLN